MAVLDIPGAVREVVRTLQAAGYRAVLVGGCVRDALQGNATRDYDVATSAPVEASLRLFPRAVPIGLRFGTILVPTSAGPVDVTRFRGPDLAADLARRDFTLNALALDPQTGELLDPHGGARDLSERRLRAVGSAAERLREDPLRALRAARLVGELSLQPDPALREALPRVAPDLARVAAERIWAELSRLLQAPGVRAGLELLRRSGLEEVLAPGIQPDAAQVVALLPEDLTLRLAGWLRGANAARSLARLRAPRHRAQEVERLLALHPVDRATALQPPAVRRLLRRARGEQSVQALFALRRAELDAAEAGASDPARKRLAELAALLEDVRGGALERSALALCGDQVMEILGVGPGRQVGRALEHLVQVVLEDPTRNEAEALRRELLAWWRSQPAR